MLAEEASAHLEARYAAAGLQAPVVRGAMAFAEALREVEEMEEARHAVAALDEGDLLLVDGALVGLPRHAEALAAPVVEAAALRGVRLAGVAKRSTVPWLGAAGLAWPGGPWRAQVPQVPGAWVARLHPLASTCFRVDVPAAPDVPSAQRDADLAVASAFSGLAALSRDAVYLGYPYPLAVAHNRVAFTAARVGQLRSRLEARAREAGLSALLDDPHVMLDRAVPG